MAYKDPLDKRNKEARLRWYYDNHEQEKAKARERKRKEKEAEKELFPASEMAITSASKPEIFRSTRELGAVFVPKDKKEEQLGMSSGKAASILRKNIMFSLVQQLDKDTCIRCNEKITSIREFSIDHIEPWLDAGIDLYWDIKNIAFSHLRCNSAAGKKIGGKGKVSAHRKVGPPGTAWCKLEKAFKPSELFTNNKLRWNGLESACKDCRRKIRERSKILDE